MEESSSKTANKILTEYFEGKSFRFVKETCESILSAFENTQLSKTEIENHNATLESLSKLRQFAQDRDVIQLI